jgi:hypothetical protein
MNTANSQKFGAWLINLGVIGLIAAVVLNFIPNITIDKGAIPAVSIILIIIGMCFFFPQLLQDDSGGVSTMRVMVLSVVVVFVLIYVKIGWSASSLEEFSIDRTWVYILGLAFGSKAIQKFGEKEDETAKNNKTADTTETTTG